MIDHVIGKSCGGMQVSGAHEMIMVGKVLFCVVVSKVGATRFPVDKELALVFIIFYPVEAHVDHLGLLLIDGIVGKPFFRLIVNAEGSGRLWVAKFSQSGTDRDGLLAINEAGADFGLGG